MVDVFVASAFVVLSRGLSLQCAPLLDLLWLHFFPFLFFKGLLGIFVVPNPYADGEPGAQPEEPAVPDRGPPKMKRKTANAAASAAAAAAAAAAPGAADSAAPAAPAAPESESAAGGDASAAAAPITSGDAPASAAEAPSSADAEGAGAAAATSSSAAATEAAATAAATAAAPSSSASSTAELGEAGDASSRSVKRRKVFGQAPAGPGRKKCDEPGCPKNARDATSGKCISHGGRCIHSGRFLFFEILLQRI